MKNIMEEVRKFLRTYPPLAEGKLHVDFLPEEAQSYSVEACACKGCAFPYVDTAQLGAAVFILCGGKQRNFSGDKIRQQLDSLQHTVISPNGCGNRPWQGKLPNLERGAGRSC